MSPFVGSFIIIALSCWLVLAPLNAVQSYTFLHQFPQRAQLSEEADSFLDRFQHILHLAIGREPSDAKPNAAMGALIAIP